jgi:hypothetical protein
MSMNVGKTLLLRQYMKALLLEARTTPSQKLPKIAKELGVALQGGKAEAGEELSKKLSYAYSYLLSLSGSRRKKESGDFAEDIAASLLGEAINLNTPHGHSIFADLEKENDLYSVKSTVDDKWSTSGKTAVAQSSKGINVGTVEQLEYFSRLYPKFEPDSDFEIGLGVIDIAASAMGPEERTKPKKGTVKPFVKWYMTNIKKFTYDELLELTEAGGFSTRSYKGVREFFGGFTENARLEFDFVKVGVDSGDLRGEIISKNDFNKLRSAILDGEEDEALDILIRIISPDNKK